MKWRFEWRGAHYVEDRDGDYLAVIHLRDLCLVTVMGPGHEPTERERREFALVKVRREEP